MNIENELENPKIMLMKIFSKWNNDNDDFNIKNYIDFKREFGELSNDDLKFLLNKKIILPKLFDLINFTFNFLIYVYGRNKKIIPKKLFEKKIDDLENTYLLISEIKDYVHGESKENIQSLIEHYKRLLSDIRAINTYEKHESSNLSIGYCFNLMKDYNFHLKTGKYKTSENWNLTPRIIKNDYSSLTDNFKGSHTLSYDDVLRLTIRNLITIFQDYAKPETIIDLSNKIFKDSYYKFTSKKISFKSLYKNTQKIRFYKITITQPILLKNVDPMYCSAIEIEIDKNINDTAKQFIYIGYGGNKNSSPEIID